MSGVGSFPVDPGIVVGSKYNWEEKSSRRESNRYLDQVYSSTRFFTIFDKLEMLVLSTAGGTQHRSHINNTFLLVIYVFSML